LAWSSRGDAGDPKRRAELRKVAAARIGHLSRAARLAISEQETEALAAVYTAGLESGAALEFVRAIPDPAELMPHLDVAELEGGAS
jgi:hypothetical protein